MLQKKSCFTCNFFDKSPQKNQAQTKNFGYCRYDAPKITSDRGEASWPVVKQDDWCGKFLDDN